MNRKITLETEKKICELYETNSESDLGIKFGLTQSGIHSVLVRNNIKSKPKYRLNPGKKDLDINFFQKINSRETAYWFGYLCGDGNIKKSLDKCTLISKDIEIIDRFKMVIKSGHKISINNIFDKRTKKTTRSYSIQITNRNFVTHLINHGLTPNKTDIMLVPEMDEIFLSYFFAGLFDSDGSVGFINKNKRISLISTKEILLYLQNYIIINFSISITKLQKVTKNKENVWKLHLYKDSLKFLEWIYSDNDFKYLNRKHQIYEQIKTHSIL